MIGSRDPARTRMPAFWQPKAMPIEGQVALVTGASSGIGRAIAFVLAGLGADVCLVARRQAMLDEIANVMRRDGARGHVYPTDLTSHEELKLTAGAVQRDWGGVNILVVCGGAIFHGQVEQAPLVQFDLQYQANVRAPYALLQLFLPSLRHRRGQIVFINSSITARTAAGTAQFAATQHALRALADILRAEVNPDGIRVLSVFPGRTATPRIEALCEEQQVAYEPDLLMQPEDIAVMVASALTLPRTAEVTDISMRPMLKAY